MKKHILIIILLGSILQGCQNKDVVRAENELFTINELLLLRTEGLILAERATHYTKNKEIQRMCHRIKNYYRTTHPDFVDLCKDRIIGVEEKDVDQLWIKIDNYLYEQQDNIETAFVNLCNDNILRSIALYEIIITRDDWEDISYFSYQALPELYHQQEELLEYYTEQMKAYTNKDEGELLEYYIEQATSSYSAEVMIN